MSYGKINNHDQKAVRKDAFLKLGLGLVALLLIVDTVQISRFGAIVERVDEYNKGVVDEIGGFRQDISLMGSDMNEMRGFLLMPTREYSFMEASKIESDTDAQELSGTEKAAYNFLTEYISDQQLAENTAKAESRMKALIGDQPLTTGLEQMGLTKDTSIADTGTAYIFKVYQGDNNALAAILDEKSTNTLSVQSILGTYQLNDENDTNAVLTYIKDNKDSISNAKNVLEERKSALLQAMQHDSIKSALAEKQSTFISEPSDTENSLVYAVQNKESKTELEISIGKKDGLVTADGTNLDTSKDLVEQLRPLINNLSTATEQEKMIAERKAELEKVFAEPAFADMLKTSGLTVASEPREDYNMLAYDVKDQNGNVKFSFIIEISSGLYKVLKDNQEIDFYSLLQDGSKKKP